MQIGKPFLAKIFFLVACKLKDRIVLGLMFIQEGLLIERAFCLWRC